MAQQQRKPAPEAAPPPRRTAIPPPANDNRVRRIAFALACAALAVVALLFAAYRALT